MEWPTRPCNLPADSRAIRIQKVTLPAELALGASKALAILSYGLFQGALHVASRPSFVTHPLDLNSTSCGSRTFRQRL